MTVQHALSIADQLRQLYERGKKETDGMAFDAAIRHVRARIEAIDHQHPDDDTFSFAYHAGFVAFQALKDRVRAASH